MNRNTVLTLRRMTILTMFALATVEVWQHNFDNSELELHPADSSTVLQIARKDSPRHDSIHDSDSL